MATLSRAATDGLITGWKASHKLAQTAWRGQGRRNNYGQVLRGGGKPADQAVAGPSLPATPNIDAWIDVYERPDGYGWVAYFVTTDTGQDWIRSVSCHEDGPLVETGWITYTPGG